MFTNSIKKMSLAQLLGFGKKRRTPAKKTPTGRPSAAVRRMCKKHGVKITLMRGGKRVYKSEKVLKAQCKKKMAAAKKAKKTSKKTPVRRSRRSRFAGGCASMGFGKRGKSYFGEDEEEEEIDVEEMGFGKRRRPSRATVARRRKAAGQAMIRSRVPRYASFGGNQSGYLTMVSGGNGCYPQYSPNVMTSKGVYGVGKPFFRATVPGTLPPAWYKNRQPDGGYVMVGAPHLAYKAPSNGMSFGKKRRSRYASSCNKKRGAGFGAAQLRNVAELYRAESNSPAVIAFDLMRAVQNDGGKIDKIISRMNENLDFKKYPELKRLLPAIADLRLIDWHRNLHADDMQKAAEAHRKLQEYVDQSVRLWERRRNDDLKKEEEAARLAAKAAGPAPASSPRS
jgi:hypothetical protein